MAVIKMQKCPTDSGACKNTIDYTSREGEIKPELSYGQYCSIDHKQAIQDFLDVKEMYQKMDGRQLYHLEMSFEKEMQDPKLAHELGIQWLEQNKDLQGFQVLMTTHTDKDHIHNHFVINSVNMEHGNKLHMHRGKSLELPNGEKEIVERSTLYQWKELSNKICQEHDLKQIDIDNKKLTLEHEIRYTQKEQEFKLKQEGLESPERSYKDDMREALLMTQEYIKERCVEHKITDPEEIFSNFKKSLKEFGLEISNQKRNSITFRNEEGRTAKGNKLDMYFKSEENIKTALGLEIKREIELNQKLEKNQEIEQKLEKQREQRFKGLEMRITGGGDVVEQQLELRRRLEKELKQEPKVEKSRDIEPKQELDFNVDKALAEFNRQQEIKRAELRERIQKERELEKSREREPKKEKEHDWDIDF